MTAATKKLPALPGPYSAAEAADRLLAVAASQIGVHEGKTGGDWNNDNPYGVWYGMNKVAWCAEFVSWCAAQAGFTAIIPKHAYTPSGYNWFAARKQTVSSPRRGDLLYVYGYVASEKRSRVHHVGIVENVLPGGYISTVEGNTNDSGSSQGDGVYRLKRKLSSRLKFVRPNYAAVVKPRPKPPVVKPVPGAKPPKPVVDKYGFPRTGGRVPVDSAGKQVLELNWLVSGAKLTAKQPVEFKMWVELAAASRSLQVLGLMPKGQAITGPNFKAAWAKYQRSLGFKGKDADGTPGAYSFSRFIERTGRSRKSPGYEPK